MTTRDPRITAALGGRVSAVLNKASGSWSADCQTKIEGIFQSAGLTDAHVESVAPADIEATLDAAMAKSSVVVVLGGDGTIRSAAEKAFERDILLVPLPGGTMNVLPKALYGERPWATALEDTLNSPCLHEISGGAAEGHAFFVAALLGAPTLWADAREALRSFHLLEAMRRSVTAARRSFAEPLDFDFGGVAVGTSEAVAVVCPLISKVMREDERGLEAAAIDTTTTGEVLRLGFHALFDDWRQDPSITRAKVKTLTVTGHGRVPVILDGERVRMGRRVTLTFRPLAFTAIVPTGDDGVDPEAKAPQAEKAPLA